MGMKTNAWNYEPLSLNHKNPKGLKIRKSKLQPIFLNVLKLKATVTTEDFRKQTYIDISMTVDTIFVIIITH